MTIYIADDDLELLGVLEEVLGALGHQVRTFPDGQELLTELARSRPDVIILDVDMPRAGGAEVIKYLYENDLLRIPVIMLTGQPGFCVEAEEHNIRYYLSKPLDADALLEALRGVSASAATPQMTAEETLRMATGDSHCRQP